MKHRLRNKLNTVVELTSLLDVIFIVLMIVLFGQQDALDKRRDDIEQTRQEIQQMSEQAEIDKSVAEDARQQAEDKMAELEAEEDLFRRQKEKLEDVTGQMTIVTLRIDYQPSHPESRTIKLRINGEPEIKIPVLPQTEDAAYAELEKKLDGILSQADSENKPVRVELVTDRMLYRDEQRAEDVLRVLGDDHRNLYVMQGI